MQLLFDYPWWCILLCLLLGAAYSAALYFKGRDSLKGKMLLLLSLLRFLAVAVIAFLLMAPMVKRKVADNEKPIVVIAQDVSQSVGEGARNVVDPQLLKDYEVVVDSFGGTSTDIAAALDDIADRYAGRNLGAIVLATDGIYNQGQNPVIAAADLAVPVYTVALGDTTRRRDASLANLRYNRTAYLGNQFPFEVTVRASRLKGEHATLTITHNGKSLFSKEIAYTSDDFSTTETAVLTADKPGVQTYTVSITPCKGEVSEQNNRRTVAVEVIDGHQKIAIAAAAPHPDVAALKQAVEHNPNYEVEVLTCESGKWRLQNGKGEVSAERWKGYDLLVLHNLPTARIAVPAAKIPTIYIVGSQTDLGRFNALHNGLQIVAKTRKTDEVTASHNGAFALFNLDDDICGLMEQMPPLAAPFGDYRMAGNTQSLFTAKIGSVASDRPLIAFGQNDGIRSAFVVGEGLWRWRLQDYQMNSSHDSFDKLVEKMVVYTSLQTNKERFRVTSQPVYRAGEAVTLEAELYNDNFEPVNTPDVELTIADKGYTFNRSGNNYVLNVGTLPPGQYNYSARTVFGGRSYAAKGSFFVEELNLETLNMVADHTLLNTLANNTGAEMLSPSEVDRLPQLLAARDDIKSVAYSHIRYTELLNLPLLFILIVLLLGAEWAVRKMTDER